MDENELGAALRGELDHLTGELEPSAKLLDELHRIPGRRRTVQRRRWMLIPAATALAGLIVTIVLLSVGPAPPSALAIELPSGRMIHVTIQEIEAVRPANQKLGGLGRVRVIAMTAGCRTPLSAFSYEGMLEHPAPRIQVGDPDIHGTQVLAAKQIGQNKLILANGIFTHTIPTCASSKGTGPGLPGWTVTAPLPASASG